MVWNFVVNLLIAVALNVVAYLISPKTKTPKPAAASDPEAPTSEAGRPIPWVFGEMFIRSPNVLGQFDKTTRQYQVKA